MGLFAPRPQAVGRLTRPRSAADPHSPGWWAFFGMAHLMGMWERLRWKQGAVLRWQDRRLVTAMSFALQIPPPSAPSGQLPPHKGKKPSVVGGTEAGVSYPCWEVLGRWGTANTEGSFRRRELSAKLTEGVGKRQAFLADNLSSWAFSHGDSSA